MPKFYIIIARKIFVPNFFLGGGARAPRLPSSPTPMPVSQDGKFGYFGIGQGKVGEIVVCLWYATIGAIVTKLNVTTVLLSKVN